MNDLFHPFVSRWFRQTFGSATSPQSVGWTHIAAGRDTLIAALFGSAFPTTIYIGHPGWKAMGAGAGYSILNGTVIAAGLSMIGLIHAHDLVPSGVQNRFGVSAAPEFALMYGLSGLFLLMLHLSDSRRRP